MVEFGVPGTLWQPNSWKAHKSTAYNMDEPCTTCSSMWELSEEMGPAVNLSSWQWQATASSMRQGIWQWLWARMCPEWVFIFGRTALLNAFPWCWTWKYAFRLELLVLVRLASLAFDLMIRNIRSTCHNQSYMHSAANKSEHRTQSVAAADFSYLMDPDSPPMALAPSLPTQTLESKVFQRLRAAKLQICTQPKCLWIDVAEGHRALDRCKMLVVTRVVHHGASKQPPTVTKWIMV